MDYMAEVKILVQGYAQEGNENEFASSTVVLIRDGGLNIVVDPGMDRERLLDALKNEELTPDKINYVILTHYHLDHTLLAGIFEKAKILDSGDIYSFDGKIKEHDGKVPGTDIEIIETPGHEIWHCSVLVQTEEFGKVAIVGDVFWWGDDEEQKTRKENLINLKDPYVKNMEQLVASRKKILEIADYIIPGHGKMFKIEK